MATMVKYERMPRYDEVEVVGRTVAFLCGGTRQRNPFKGRRILTETSGFDAGSTDPDRPECRKVGTENEVVQTVARVGSVGVRVRLEGGFETPALEFRDVLVYEDARDNKGALVVLMEEGDAGNREVVGRLEDFAERIVAMHPESFGIWDLRADDGRRVFLYGYAGA